MYPRRVLAILLFLPLLAVALAAPRSALAAIPPPSTGGDQLMGWVITAGEQGVTEVNVRTAPSLKAPIVKRQPVGAPIMLYGMVVGQAVQPGNPFWYRISPPSAHPIYMYAPYISTKTLTVPPKGKVILVSLANQWLIAFDQGKVVVSTPVTTGRPELPTPTGTFHVMAKYAPYTFISPWPVGSPFYYAPSPVRFAMAFESDGYFLHDAPWRSVYGPGTNLPHDDPGDPLGSHGCVNIPEDAAATLFHWASVGTTVRIIA